MAKKRKVCPFCYAEVNKENLERHFMKVHGELSKEEFIKKGLKKPKETSGGKKKRQVGKREAKKGYKLNNKGRCAIIAAIVLIIIVSLLGAIIFQNLGQNKEPNGDSNGEANGKTNGDIPNNGNGETNLPVAIMATTLGTIKIELDTEKAPGTAGNFIDHVNSGFYDGIIFHRVIAGFVIQGGGFTSDETKKTADSIPWENTGLLNSKYTISMARSGDPNSEADSGTGSSQFFINLADNANLDSYAYPYVVFGRVIEGFSVVDTIAALPTDNNDWPYEPPVITSVVIQG